MGEVHVVLTASIPLSTFERLRERANIYGKRGFSRAVRDVLLRGLDLSGSKPEVVADPVPSSGEHDERH